MHGHLQRFAQPHSIAGNQLVQCYPIHILHGNEVDSVGFIDVINGDDVRMVQRGGGLGFQHEPFLVLRHQFGQDLILGLDLLLQIGDPLLLCGMVGPRFQLKGSRAVLEELLLPAVEDRGLESLFVTQL